MSNRAVARAGPSGTDMDDTNVNLINSLVNQLISLSPPVLLVVVLMGTGWALKQWPLFNDRFIPHMLILIGGVAWPFLAPPKEGIVLVIFQGIGLGLLAVGAHQFIKQHLPGAKDVSIGEAENRRIGETVLPVTTPSPPHPDTSMPETET